MCAIENAVANELINGSGKYDDARMKLLARSICGVEYYLEGARENRVHADSALEVAERYIQELGYELTSAVVEEDSLPPSEPIEALPSPPAEPVVAEEVGNELAVMGDDTDEEIVEIFLEEVDEEIESIQKNLPAWIHNPEDKESLATLRRSFHTLKGSGRLVGAMRMGEFSWAMENLLNRVIENTVPLTTFVTDVLTEASSLLVELATQIKDGTLTQGPVSQLMERADALSSGETPQAEETVSNEVVCEDDSSDDGMDSVFI